MGWFRWSRGRHALGAPKRVVEPVVVVPPFVPVPVASNLSFFSPVGSAAVTTPAPAQPTELAVPVAVEAVPPPTHLAEPTPAVDTEDLLGSIAALIVSGQAWVETPVVPVQRTAPVVAAPPQARTFAPALVPQLPVPTAAVEAAAVEPPAPRVSRVQLGFRDGTTASLDPDSAQAAALEELALLLSLRD